MTDLLPFLRLYRQHWLSLTIGLLLALVIPLLALFGMLLRLIAFFTVIFIAFIAVMLRVLALLL